MVVAVPTAIAAIVPTVVVEANPVLITTDVVAGIVRRTIILMIWTIILAIVVGLHAIVAILQTTRMAVEMDFLTISTIRVFVATAVSSVCTN